MHTSARTHTHTWVWKVRSVMLFLKDKGLLNGVAHSIQNICDAWIKEIKNFITEELSLTFLATLWHWSKVTVTKIGTHRYNHASFVSIAVEYTDITFFLSLPTCPPHTQNGWWEKGKRKIIIKITDHFCIVLRLNPHENKSQHPKSKSKRTWYKMGFGNWSKERLCCWQKATMVSTK